MNRLPRGVQRTTVRLHSELLGRLTSMARDRGCTRSVLISDLLRDCLDSQAMKLRESRR